MKNLSNILGFFCFIGLNSFVTFAQIGINSTGAAPAANAMLDVSSTTKGALLPRMSSAQRTALTTSDGLTVYDTDTKSYWFVKGAVWTEMVGGAGGGSSPWTVSGSNIYNNNSGNVGIGTTTPTSKLNVNGQITIDQKNFGGYGGLLVKGNKPGLNYPNIAFSTNNENNDDIVTGMIGGEITNDSYGYESMNLQFMTMDPFDGLTERMKINNLGNIGIGLNPSHKLHIGFNNYFNQAGLRVDGPETSGGIGASFGGFGDFQVDKPGIVGGRFIIKNDGKVGVGKNNPQTLLEVNGEITSTNANSFRSVFNGYGSFLRNDGNGTYLLLTNNGDPYGGFNGLRPFSIDNTNGSAQLGNSSLFVQHNNNSLAAPLVNISNTGAVAFSGNSGIGGQLLTSGGNANSPTWINKSDIVSFTNIPQTLPLVATPLEVQIGNDIIINAKAPGNLVVWLSTTSNYVCTNPIAPCFYVYNANTYINGSLSKVNTLQGFTQLVPPTFITDQAIGPIVIQINSAGNHTLSFKIQSFTPNIIPLTVKLNGAAVFYPNF